MLVCQFIYLCSYIVYYNITINRLTNKINRHREREEPIMSIIDYLYFSL